VASKGYETGNTTSDNESRNIKITGIMGKTSATDFAALDDLTPVPRNINSDSENSPATKSLSKLEMRLNSIKRVPKE